MSDTIKYVLDEAELAMALAGLPSVKAA